VYENTLFVFKLKLSQIQIFKNKPYSFMFIYFIPNGQRTNTKRHLSFA